VSSGGPSFAHASEAELARILDFYDVRWAYEPDTFPIGWNLDGAVVESFSPDFYLPDLDLYIELTTLKQKLVRKKNRKLRRLRELYPDVRIKLFYARDFRMLMLKFGRMALIDELTGTTGQASPTRPIDGALPPDAVAPGDRAAATAVPGSPARGPRHRASGGGDPVKTGVASAPGSGPVRADVGDGLPGPAVTPRGRRRGRRRRGAATMAPDARPAPADRAGQG
jgi:hypothetical protein